MNKLSKISLIFTLSLFIGLGFVFGAKAQETAGEADVVTEEANKAVGEEAAAPVSESELSEPVEEEVTASDLGVSEPLILPTSPFYGLKTWWRGLRERMTADPVKKTELKLKYANQKLLEAKKVAEQTDDGTVVEEALANYNEDMQEVESEVESLQEAEAENPSYEALKEKFADRGIKQQVVLKIIGDKLTDEQKAKVEEVRQKVMERWSNVAQKVEGEEQFRERLENVLGKGIDKAAPRLQHIAVLDELKKKLPPKAREVITNVENKEIEKLKENIQEGTQELKERIAEKLEENPELKQRVIEAAPVIRGKLEELGEKLRARAKDYVKDEGDAPRLPLGKLGVRSGSPKVEETPVIGEDKVEVEKDLKAVDDLIQKPREEAGETAVADLAGVWQATYDLNAIEWSVAGKKATISLDEAAKGGVKVGNIELDPEAVAKIREKLVDTIEISLGEKKPLLSRKAVLTNASTKSQMADGIFTSANQKFLFGKASAVDPQAKNCGALGGVLIGGHYNESSDVIDKANTTVGVIAGCKGLFVSARATINWTAKRVGG